MDDTSAPPQHTRPQSDPGSLPRCFPPVIKERGVLKALPQFHHPLSCPAVGSCTKVPPMEWLFSLLCVFLMFCGVKCFTVAGVQILPPTSEKSNPTATGHLQTQLVMRYGWPLAHKELRHPFTGFDFNAAGCPYHTPSSPGNLVGETVSSLTTRQ